jgi:hypothetical protein
LLRTRARGRPAAVCAPAMTAGGDRRYGVTVTLT